MDRNKFQTLIKNLYLTVDELETMFPVRHFTPDGHMVGSIGECLVADAYDLELMAASNKGFDASSNGQFEEVYNGPGELVWKQFEGRKMPSNGQFQISLTKLKLLNDQVHESQRIPRIV